MSMQRRQDVGRVGARRRRGDVSQTMPRAPSAMPSGNQRPWADPRHEDVRASCAASTSIADHRQEREAGLDRRVARGELQVVGQEQEDAEHARRRRSPIARKAPPRLRSSTTRSGSSGCATRRCDQDERDQQDAAPATANAERQRGAPAVGLGVGEAEDEREQAGRREQRARDVEPRPRSVRATCAEQAQRAPTRPATAKTTLTYRHQRQ